MCVILWFCVQTASAAQWGDVCLTEEYLDGRYGHLEGSEGLGWPQGWLRRGGDREGRDCQLADRHSHKDPPVCTTWCKR